MCFVFVAKHQQVLRLKIQTDKLNLNDPAVHKHILDSVNIIQLFYNVWQKML